MLEDSRSDQKHGEPEPANWEYPASIEVPHLITYGPWPGADLPEDLMGMYFLS